jgi:3-oxoacyl-[acyl-carrier protein] reductase
VVVNFLNNEVRAEAVVQDIKAAGGEGSAYRADVTDPDAVSALVDYATELYGPVDALVNNAGDVIHRQPLTDTKWLDIERDLAVHLRGSVQCISAVLPTMIDRKFGRIVNLTSQSAYGIPPANMTAYVVAKGALAAYTRCVALEAGPHGVTANAVAPGMVETDLVADIPQRAKLVLAAQAPLRRLGSASDVADTVAFLLSPGASGVTGQTIHLSSGQVMA